MSEISKIFKDHDGKVSSTRLVYMITILTIMAVWAYTSIIQGEMQSFSTGDALWIGTLVAGKSVGKHIEKK